MGETKYIIVTGGVLSGLGKGIATASIGYLLKNQLRVIPIKCDGYLNVDPGTMNPLEHGEVYVLDDGGEVDMDFGHYERFLGTKCKSEWNLTMGKVFDEVRKKERRGDYLGRTVQYIPHVVNLIKEKFYEISRKENAEIVLIEIGGTAGDIENSLYLEAVRQMKKDVGKGNIIYVHLTYIPIPTGVKEQKSKPTQQSVELLRQRGIQPDIIVGRCNELLTDKIKGKIAEFCDIEKEAVITGLDVGSIYEVPLVFNNEGMAKIINRKLNLDITPKLERLKELIASMNRQESKEINVAMCGKYTDLEDSYASVIESLKHAVINLGHRLKIKWVETTNIEKGIICIEEAMKGIDGVIVPGGFGSRGAEGKISVIKYCRENNKPFLGLCYGMQLAVIEYARNVCNMEEANSSEINPSTKLPVIDILPEQRIIKTIGATMRLGGQDIMILPGTQASKMFGNSVRLRFRHRYEVNPKFVNTLENGGIIFSGKNNDGKIMQIMELPKEKHNYFIATQAHPEFMSTIEEPNPLFIEFIRAIDNLP